MTNKICINIGSGEKDEPNKYSKRGTLVFEVSETWFSPMISIRTNYTGSKNQQEFILNKENFQELANFFQKAADRKWYTDTSVGQGDLDTLGRGTIQGCSMDYDKPRATIVKEKSSIGFKTDDSNNVKYKLAHKAIKGTLNGAIYHKDKVIQVFHSRREYEGCEAIKLIDFTYEKTRVEGGKHATFSEEFSYPLASDIVTLNWTNIPEESYLVVGYDYVIEEEKKDNV